MKHILPQITLAVVIALVMLVSAAFAEQKEPAAHQEVVAYDEAKQGDLGPLKPDSKTAVRVTTPGVFAVKGTGTDAVDDADAFLFEVAGDKPF